MFSVFLITSLLPRWYDLCHTSGHM